LLTGLKSRKFNKPVSPGAEFAIAEERRAMKKKETFWELLERLDRQAGEFNVHLSEANRYFDTAADQTRKILERQEKDLHATIAKVKVALKKFRRDNEPKSGPREKKSTDKS
jgi:hypothetical protein